VKKGLGWKEGREAELQPDKGSFLRRKFRWESTSNTGCCLEGIRIGLHETRCRAGLRKLVVKIPSPADKRKVTRKKRVAVKSALWWE